MSLSCHRVESIDTDQAQAQFKYVSENDRRLSVSKFTGPGWARMIDDRWSIDQMKNSRQVAELWKKKGKKWYIETYPSLINM